MEKNDVERLLRMRRELPRELGVCCICNETLFSGVGFVSYGTGQTYCIDCVKKTGLKQDEIGII